MVRVTFFQRFHFCGSGEELLNSIALFEIFIALVCSGDIKVDFGSTKRSFILRPD